MRSNFQPQTVSRVVPMKLASVVVGAVWLAAGCGDGGGIAASSSPAGVSAESSFPGGLAVGSPGDVSAAGPVAALQPWDGPRFVADWGRAAQQAIRQRDSKSMASLATALLPIGQAHAAGSKLELEADAEIVDKLLSGDAAVSPGSHLDPQKLFSLGSDATCYGPNMPYASHEDGAGASGTLPSGDLGLWLATEGVTGTPCIVEQLSRRVSGVKQRTRQGLLMMAVMRRVVAANSLTMPSAASSIDIKTQVATKMSTISSFAGVTVDAATVSLNAGSTTYTYRLAL